MLTLGGVSQRIVMELMRHSDMRLTAKTYTDAHTLPVSDAVSKLPPLGATEVDAQIDAQILVHEGPTLSAGVPGESERLQVLSTGNQTFSPSESSSVRARPKAGEWCAMQGSNLYLPR